MASPEFVEITATANVAEAEMLRSVLEESGVRAFVDGAAANTALSHIGPALGGVKVFVRTVDAEQALEIIEEIRAESNVSTEPWFCGTCEESIDGSFDVCWSCGQDRANAERPFPAVRDEEESSDDGEGDELIDLPIPDRSEDDEANPYATPMTTEPTVPDNRPPEINEAAEVMLERAWRASIIGFVFLPFIMQLYSIYLLIRAATITDTFSPIGRKRFNRSMAANMIAACIYGLIIAIIFR